MIELRFHHELYDGFAIDEAAKIYAPFASFELVREPEGYVVRLTATDTSDGSASEVTEVTVASEFATYALGLTVQKASAES